MIYTVENVRKSDIEYIKSEDHDDSRILLTLFTSESCNLHCDYCLTGDRSRGFMHMDTVINVMNYADTLETDIEICLFGGEPTLNPYIIDIIKYIQSRSPKSISINTNVIGISVEKWVEISKVCPELKVFCTYHPLEVSTTEYRLKYLCLKKLFNSVFNTFVYDETTKKYLECVKKLDPQTQVFVNCFKSDLYPIEFLAKFDSEPFIVKYTDGSTYCASDAMLLKTLRFNDYICDSGKSVLFVRSNGDVVRCLSTINKRIFNINNEKSWLYLSPSTCTTDDACRSPCQIKLTPIDQGATHR